MVLDSAAPQLADLELLLSVDRLGSLGKAAREHNMSQPAASVRIKAMERRLGHRLLERSPSGSRFTPAGAMIAQWAQATVDAATRLLACSASLNDIGSASVRVSACLTMAECLVPRWLSVLRNHFPDVEFCVRANDHESVLADLRSGKADLGFVNGPVSDVGLRYQPVGHEELVVVVAPDHAWAHRDGPLEPSELAQGRLVLRDGGFGGRETLRQALGDAWQDGTHLELPSTFAIKEAVETGAVAGVLSSMAVDRDLRDGRLVRVPTACLRLGRRLRAAWDRSTGPSPVARALLEIALQEQAGATAAPGSIEPRRRRDDQVRALSTAQRHEVIPASSAS